MVSLWMKAPYTLFVAVLVPVYWRHYGPANFLWFSDVALLGALAAMWLDHRLLASMRALCGLLPDLLWNVDFAYRLVSGHHTPLNMTQYMFNSQLPLYLRGLSLFHIFLPPLLVWMVYRMGYDRRALPAMTLLACLVLLASYVLTSEEKNINNVLGAQGRGGFPWQLLKLMILLPLLGYLPAHLTLGKLFPTPH
jgi:hypothetical protein